MNSTSAATVTVAGAIATAVAESRRLLSRFQPGGSLPDVAPASGTDFSSTHWSKEANGLAATSVTQLLERALLSGDGDLIREGLRLPRALGPGTHNSRCGTFRRGPVPGGGPYWILIQGFNRQPQVKINGAEVPLTDPHPSNSTAARLILQLRGSTEVKILIPARDGG